MSFDRPRLKSLVYIGFSLLLTIGVFAYLLTHVTWRQVADLILSIHRPLVGLFIVLSLVLQIVRTLRYRVVLKSVGEAPGFIRLFLVVLVRGLCVDLLPARTGELVYIYLLRVKLGVELGAATASFALAFLFDLMALGPLLVVALAMVGSGATFSPLAGMGAAAGLLGATVLALRFLPEILKLGFGGCAILPRRAAPFRRWARRFMAATHRQVHRARARGVYMPVFGLSVGVRLLKYAALYVLLLAMLHPHGYTLQNLPFPKVFLGLCAAEMAAGLPISGIGGFGAYQGAWALVFILLGFPAEMAQATSISHHLFTQVYGYLVGLTAVLALLLLPGARAAGKRA
jgi:uncharacterized membrane protein YbhN (UPF0104 family)